jgi:serine/threonine protein kinase
MGNSDEFLAAITAHSPADFQEEEVSELIRRGKQIYDDTQSGAVGGTMEIVRNSGKAEQVGESSDKSFHFLEPTQDGVGMGMFGTYRILDVLGRGGMGIVFLAEESVLKRHVAVKVMLPHVSNDPVSKDRFLREAQAMAAVVSDHVVSIHQVGEIDGLPFLEMPLLKGESLRDRLEKSSARLTLKEVCRLGQEIAAGLAKAHELGLVHRDVKPDNIWLEERTGRVKILDFGLARAADESELTQSGTILGTPAYMSPEQAEGNQADHRTDLFSLGSLLYRCASGEQPFAGTSPASILLKVVQANPAPLHEVAELPRAADNLIMQLLSKNPSDRPQSAGEVADRFAQIGLQLESGVPAADPESATSSLQSQQAVWKQKSFPIGRIVTAITAVALSAFVIWLASVIFTVETPDGKIYVQIDKAEKPLAINVLADKTLLIEDPNDGKQVRVTIDREQQLLRMEKEGFVVATKAFSLASEDGRTIAIRFEPKAETVAKSTLPTNDGDAMSMAAKERAIAEWIIGKKGRVNVQVGGVWNDISIVSTDQLPKSDFVVKAFQLPTSAFQNDEARILSGLSSEVSVGFTDTKVTGKCFRYIGEIPQLRYLDFQSCKDIEGSSLSYLSTSPLQIIVAISSHVGDELAELASKNESLQHVDFGSKTTGDGLKKLANCKHIETIGLAECPLITASDLSSLAMLPNLKNLTLDVPRAKTDADALNAFVNQIAKIESLESLAVRGQGKIEAADFEALNKLHGLKELDVSYFEWDVDACKLVRSMKSLKRLVVRGTSVTKLELQELAKALPNCEIYGDDGKVAAMVQ